MQNLQWTRKVFGVVKGYHKGDITCPLDVGVLVPPWEEDEEAAQYDDQAS